MSWFCIVAVKTNDGEETIALGFGSTAPQHLNLLNLRLAHKIKPNSFLEVPRGTSKKLDPKKLREGHSANCSPQLHP
jgi:hypothetical protein